MFAPRTHHTATLLKDGRVFIAGGSPAIAKDPNNGDVLPSGALDTAEFFQPKTGNFTGVFNAMTTARSEHTATLLKDGTVLIVGGLDRNGTALASAEIFDPHQQTFTPTAGPLRFSRYDHVATLIECGKGCPRDGGVLITGGFDNGLRTNASTQKAEFYNPSSKAFEAAGTMVSGRALHGAIPLPDGAILITGGIDGPDQSDQYVNVASAEVFDPFTGTFTATQNNMSIARSGAAVAQVKVNGSSKVMVSFGGQADFNGAFFSTSSTSDLYDPMAGSFSAGPASPATCPTDTIVNPNGCAITRAGHTATVLSNGHVLIAGGIEATAVRFRSTEIYDLTSEKFSAGPNMSEDRVFQTATVLGGLNTPGLPHAGNILIAGGNPPCDGTAERYDPIAKTFTSTGSMTDPNRCTFFTSTPLADGRVLFTGGLDVDQNVLSSAEIYDPSSDSFTSTGSMTTPRWGHSAVPVTDGTGDVLILGGSNCSAQNCNGFLTSAELFDPATGTFTATLNPLSRDRFFGTANALTIPGNIGIPNAVLVAGGSGDNTAELYNPAKQQFTFATNMNFIRFFQAVTALPGANGLTLLTGGSGRNAFDNLIPLSSAEIFDPVAGIFCGTGDMSIGRAFHSATLVGTGTDARVLVAGGFGDNTSLGSAELYNPPLNSACSGKSAAFKSIPRAAEALSMTMRSYLNALSNPHSARQALLPPR